VWLFHFHATQKAQNTTGIIYHDQLDGLREWWILTNFDKAISLMIYIPVGKKLAKL
jgi:hypothetical protein